VKIENGEYLGKIKNYGFKNTKNGDAMVVVLFDVEVGPDNIQHLDWSGSFKEKAKPITLKALATMGFDFQAHDAQVKWIEMATGPISGALDVGTAVSLTIENEMYDGKLFPKIRWINGAGSLGRFRNLFTRDEAVQAFAGSDILEMGRGLMQQQQHPAAAAPKKPQTQPENKGWDVPF